MAAVLFTGESRRVRVVGLVTIVAFLAVACADREAAMPIAAGPGPITIVDGPDVPEVTDLTEADRELRTPVHVTGRSGGHDGVTRGVAVVVVDEPDEESPAPTPEPAPTDSGTGSEEASEAPSQPPPAPAPGESATQGWSYAQDFSASSGWFHTQAQGISSVSNDRSGRGVSSLMPTGAHWGGRGTWYPSRFTADGTDPDELWFRYWIRLDEGFYVRPEEAGKLPGPAGFYGDGCFGGRRSTADRPCWSARMMFLPHFEGRTRLGYYVYHLDQNSGVGNRWGWDWEKAGLYNGQWYCIEGRVRLNAPGKADGILEGWVNGTGVFRMGDVRFRRAGEEHIGVRDFYFSIYYGGKVTSPRDNRVQFDSFAMGSSRVGC